MVKYSADKLKTNLRLAASRMKLQANKKANWVINEKAVVAQLLLDKKEDTARIKIEAIVREDDIISAYNILQIYIEELLTRLPLMNSQKGCPPECVTAVSTLLYASTRVQIDEFRQIRAQLAGKFGPVFVKRADENVDNCVNEKIVARLSLSVPQAGIIQSYLENICEEKKIPYELSQPLMFDGGGYGVMMPGEQMDNMPIAIPMPMNMQMPMPMIQPQVQPQVQQQPMVQPQVQPMQPQMPVNPTMPSSSPNSVSRSQDVEFPPVPLFPSVPDNNVSGPPASGGDDVDDLMARLNALKK